MARSAAGPVRVSAVADAEGRRGRPNVAVESGPVLRQITVRAPSVPAHAGRMPGRALVALLLFAAVLLGGAAGALIAHAIWKPSITTAQAKAALGAETAPLFLHAYDLQRAGKFGQAQQEYLQIVADDPLNSYAHYDLGLIYQETNHLTAARVEYEKTLLINSKYQPALYNLAILETSDSPNTAISLYRQLQNLRPANAAAVAFNLGLLYLQVGKKAPGIAQVRYAVRLDPALGSRIPSTYQRLICSSSC